MTVLQLLICILWCQRLLRQNEYCCYKLLLRVEKKKSKHFCSILRQVAAPTFMSVRFAFWMSHALCRDTAALFREGLSTQCAVSPTWVQSLCIPSPIIITVPCDHKITRRMKVLIPIMRVIFYYLNSKWVVFFLWKCLIIFKKGTRKGQTFISLCWTTIYM